MVPVSRYELLIESGSGKLAQGHSLLQPYWKDMWQFTLEWNLTVVHTVYCTMKNQVIVGNGGTPYSCLDCISSLVPGRTLKYVFLFWLWSLTSLLVLTPSSSNYHVQEALCLSFQGKKQNCYIFIRRFLAYFF